MFDSPAVEVVIGLTFVFLILSLCATAIVEGVIEWRQWRGRLLHSKIRTLLGKRLAELFYQDRRICDLASGAASKPFWVTRLVDNVPGVSALQRRWLGWGLFTATSRHEAVAIARSMNAKRLPSQIPDGVFADVILDWLQGIELPLQLQPELAAPDAIPDRLARLWQAMSLRADGSQVALRSELQQWYVQSMERTTGEFKRRVRFALYLAGILLVLATNADTIKVASNLYRDPLLRAQTVAMAERAVDSCPDGPQGCPELKAYVEETLDDSSAMGLLGWAEGEDARLWGSSDLAWSAIGWLLTVLAIGLGADFWFGALRKMLTLRAGSIEANRAELEARAAPSRSESPAPRSSIAQEPLDLQAPVVSRLRGFQPLRYAESNVHAFWLAHLASLAYSDAAALQGSALLQHHRLAVHSLDAGGTQAFVFTGPEVCIVAFRGTETKLEDWLTDADARQQQNPWGHADERVKIHRGFHAALDNVWPELINRVSQAALPVWFTGHSLGGALAVLAAYRLEASEKIGIRVAGVYTFGQPRVGNLAWTKSVPVDLEQRIFRYVNDRDIVPLVPPAAPIEYRHVGHARYFDASGRLHHNRTLWERIAEQLSPAMAHIAAGGEDWAAVARDHARERVADHGMARYIECLERLDAVRSLWKPADLAANEPPVAP
jgi:hypothetical protein